MNPSSDRLQPLASSERIATLDVLRGFALFGILLMNMEAYSGPLDLAFTGIDPHWLGVDRWADAFVYVFVQGKFFTLFSLLFGMGFALMAQRADAARRSFSGFFLRRSAALLLIGLCHGLLLWAGDILLAYALLSFLLLAFREAPRSWLPLMGVLCYLFASVMMLALGALMSVSGQAGHEAMQASMSQALVDIEAARQVYTHGTWLQVLAQRGWDVLTALAGLPVIGPEIFGMFLLGAWFVRSGVIAQPQAHARLFAGLRWLAWPLGLGMMLTSTVLEPWQAPGRFDLALSCTYALSSIASLLMCLGYMAWVVHWRVRLQWLAPAGRMALSNYIGQSLLCTFLFYGYGLGAFEQMPRLWQLVFAVALFALQGWLSHCWLRHFRFGPLEWVWRAMSYGQWPPLRQGGVAAG